MPYGLTYEAVSQHDFRMRGGERFVERAPGFIDRGPEPGAYVVANDVGRLVAPQRGYVQQLRADQAQGVLVRLAPGNTMMV